MHRERGSGDGTVSEVVLFHSVLGLRPAVRAWAERLRGEGHVVHTPDLYGGRVFDDMESAFQHLEEMGGIEAWIERTHAAVEGLPDEVVYAGFSNGGGSAQLLALTRTGARAAVLMHAALPVEAFGASGWPSAVPLQIHYAEGDPFRDSDAVAALRAAARRAGAHSEFWEYPCAGHLFADPASADHDAAAAGTMFGRVSRFLRELPAPADPGRDDAGPRRAGPPRRSISGGDHSEF